MKSQFDLSVALEKESFSAKDLSIILEMSVHDINNELAILMFKDKVEEVDAANGERRYRIKDDQ